MVLKQIDPVLKGVGVLLVIALAAWVGLALITPPAPADAEQKVTKFTSSGKYLGTSCCMKPDIRASECGSTAAYSGCQKDGTRWTKAECSRYKEENGCQNWKNCQVRPCLRT